MILRPTRNLGLLAFIALLLILAGAAVWLRAAVPDAKSCIGKAVENVRRTGEVGKLLPRDCNTAGNRGIR